MNTKKITLLVIMMALAIIPSNAQQITVEEPEFVGTYCILTSDSTCAVLPKESGTIKKHQSKFSRLAKVVSAVATVGGAVGGIVGVNAGSFGAFEAGMKTMGTAANVGEMADAADVLAGAEGMDIVFDGGASSYSVPEGMRDVRLLIKGYSNEQDPMSIYRIVRFSTSKKERRIQWMEIKPALLGSSKAEKGGYVNFTGHKYGNQSYLITIPESELKKREYGIFYMSIITSTSLPVGTFSVK